MDTCAENRLALAAGFRACRQLILALGDETRQQILTVLLESEQVGLRVGELTARTHLSRPAVSHHLKILKDAKIITMRRKGTMNFYYVNADDTEWSKLERLIHQVCETVRRANAAGYPPGEDEG